MTDNDNWRWPIYQRLIHDGTDSEHPAAPALPVARPRLPGLASACFIEWRYWSVLSEKFHGIVGLSLVNPEQRFAGIAEGGLLLIIAGLFDRPEHIDRGPQPRFEPPLTELCWMHLFPITACTFDQPRPGWLRAGDAHGRIEIDQHTAAEADLRIDAAGLRLSLSHRGLPEAAIEPVLGADLDRGLAALMGSHWQVHCPSPVATCDGEIRIEPGALATLANAPGGTADSYATPALRARVAAGERVFDWQRASGYYEHSFGMRPLPLHGWDFLFIPDAERRQSVIMQTYRGSRALRYLEVCWRQDGEARYQRFSANSLQLRWAQTTDDPLLRARRPLRRLIQAEAGGLRLQVDNRILHRIALLRPYRLAVRHFFISEEIGIADWTLRDARGHVIAEAVDQPCGGELAQFRWRT